MRENCTATFNHVEVNVAARQTSRRAWERQEAAARATPARISTSPDCHQPVSSRPVTRSGGRSSANHSVIGTQTGILEHPTRHSVVKWAVPGRESLLPRRRTHAFHQDARRRAAHPERCRSAPSHTVPGPSHLRRTSCVSSSSPLPGTSEGVRIHYRLTTDAGAVPATPSSLATSD
jgi:hypothetical protein